MKRYNYTVGTYNATKIVDKKSNPPYLKRQNILIRMKSYYKGDTTNYEWQ